MRLPNPRPKLPLLLLLVAIIAGVIGWHVHGLHLRRQAIATIEEKGGNVLFKHEIDALAIKGVRYEPSPPGPRWIRRIIGDDAFATVMNLTLDGREFTDDDIELLKQFPMLSYLDISDSRVTDKGLREIAALQHLRFLDVSGAPIGSVGLRNLRQCASLRTLVVAPDAEEDVLAELQSANPQLRVQINSGVIDDDHVLPVR